MADIPLPVSVCASKALASVHTRHGGFSNQAAYEESLQSTERNGVGQIQGSRPFPGQRGVALGLERASEALDVQSLATRRFVPFPDRLHRWPYLLASSHLHITANPRCSPGRTKTPGPEPAHRTRDPISVLKSDLHQPLERTGSTGRSSLKGPRISVVVVAAEQLFAFGLARLLGEDDCLEVIGVSDGQTDVLELCVVNSIDVVLIDLELLRANCIDVVRLLASECPATRTLVLTSNPDWRVRAAMVAGASGVLLKDTSPEATRAAVVSVHLGDQILCNEAARWVLGEDPSAHLTQRESDVLQIMAQGANNAEIARQLHLGEKTVRNYVSRLYRKLDLNNRAQFARYVAHTDTAPRTGRTDSTLDSEVSVQPTPLQTATDRR